MAIPLNNRYIHELSFTLLLLLLCLPTPLTLVFGESPIIPILVHLPVYLSIWPADPSLLRGLSTNYIYYRQCGVYVGAIEEMMCVVCVSVAEGA